MKVGSYRRGSGHDESKLRQPPGARGLHGPVSTVRRRPRVPRRRLRRARRRGGAHDLGSTTSTARVAATHRWMDRQPRPSVARARPTAGAAPLGHATCVVTDRGCWPPSRRPAVGDARGAGQSPLEPGPKHAHVRRRQRLPGHGASPAPETPAGRGALVRSFSANRARASAACRHSRHATTPLSQRTTSTCARRAATSCSPNPAPMTPYVSSPDIRRCASP
jgi:hypothetical protein